MATKYYYPNYPFDDLRDDKFLASNNFYEKTTPTLQKFVYTGRYTFHSPDTHFTEPDLGHILKLEAEMSGTAKGFFNISEDQAKYKLLNEKQYSIATSISKWIASTQQTPTQEATTSLFSNAGSSLFGGLGSAVGNAIAPGVGGAVGGSAGGALGSLIGTIAGKIVYNKSQVLQFMDSVYRSTVIVSQTEAFVSLFKNLASYHQHHYQYQAVGNYHSIAPYNQLGNKIREIETSAYVDPGKYTIDQTFLNNYNRESSVYLKIKGTLPVPVNKDKSRVLISETSAPSTVSETEVITTPCYKFSITWNKFAEPVRVAVWGVLCNPVRYNPNPSGTVGDIIFVSGPSQWGSTRQLFKIEKFADGFNYVIEQAIFMWNSKVSNNDLQFGSIAGNLLDYCYSSLYFRGVENKILDGNPDDNEIIGEDNVIISEKSVCAPSTKQVTRVTEFGCACNEEVTTPIFSYYGAIKQENPNQYGTIYDINWIPLQSCTGKTNKAIFGGDTFIGRFSLKRKHSFFSNTSYNLPNDTAINYSVLANVAYPVYYFDTNPLKKNQYIESVDLNVDFNALNGLLLFKKLFPLLKSHIFKPENYVVKPKYKFDCGQVANAKRLDLNAVSGIIYAYSYGIPYFIGESEVNLDLRDKGTEVYQDFYPSQSDLSYWLQQKTVEPVVDNYYDYDSSYSKQPTEEFHFLNTPAFKGEDCDDLHTNRVIYTSQSQNIADDGKTDNFLVNKALDYYDFSKTSGKVISIENLEGDKVLVRQENASSVFGAYIEINTNQETATLSVGNIFRNKPQEFTKPTVGYFGTQHKAISHTPFGHVTVDAKRGNIFVLANNASGLDEISNKGMKHWFKENLPFCISKHLPGVNIDNNYAGIGIAIGYDNRFNTVFITKLDYEPTPSVKYENGQFKDKFTNQVIELSNTTYFCNKSWTASYNFYVKDWISFHSFTPLYYLEYEDHFDTGNKTGLWKHNVTNKDYQRYYGKLEPFVVETLNSKVDLINHNVESVNYIVDVIQYFNNYDYVYLKEKSFNKAIVFNESQNSGLLNLEDLGNNLFLKAKYPILENNFSRVSLTKKENYHSFNQFKDRVYHKNIPVWVYSCNNIIKELNQVAFSYNSRLNYNPIRSLQNKVRLIQDTEFKYKYIFKGTYINDNESRRI
jgi:hypothetical protein